MAADEQPELEPTAIIPPGRTTEGLAEAQEEAAERRRQALLMNLEYRWMVRPPASHSVLISGIF